MIRKLLGILVSVALFLAAFAVFAFLMIPVGSITVPSGRIARISSVSPEFGTSWYFCTPFSSSSL